MSTDMKYSNFETLKKNSDFKKVYNKKISYANKYLVMYILENGTDTLRLRHCCYYPYWSYRFQSAPWQNG